MFHKERKGKMMMMMSEHQLGRGLPALQETDFDGNSLPPKAANGSGGSYGIDRNIGTPFGN